MFYKNQNCAKNDAAAFCQTVTCHLRNFPAKKNLELKIEMGLILGQWKNINSTKAKFVSRLTMTVHPHKLNSTIEAKKTLELSKTVRLLIKTFIDNFFRLKHKS